MANVRYGTATEDGAWRIAVAGHALAALPHEVPVRTVEAVWKRLGAGAGIGALLEALTGAFGTSLTAIPHFALAVAEDDGMRVAVRGPLELVVQGSNGAEAISGSGVSTWVERFLPGVNKLSLSFGQPLDDAAALPIADGIVAASALVFTVDAVREPVAAREVPPQESSVVEPDAEPGELEPEVAASVADPEPALERAAEPEPEPLDGRVEEPVRSAPTPILEPEEPEGLEPSAESEAQASPAADEPPALGDTWLPITSTSVPLDSPLPAGETQAPAFDLDDEDVWGETVARPLQVEVADPAPASAVEDAAEDAPGYGDHDGETIAVADLRAMREAEQERFESTDQVPPRKPRQGRIRLSTGRVVELERAVIIGRRPRSPRASGDALPILIAVDSPEQDISRSHVEIKAEGEHVLITDLDTTNGSILIRGGLEPVRLHPNEPTMVISGDVVDIGDGVTITFEDLP